MRLPMNAVRGAVVAAALIGGATFARTEGGTTEWSFPSVDAVLDRARLQAATLPAPRRVDLDRETPLAASGAAKTRLSALDPSGKRRPWDVLKAIYEQASTRAEFSDLEQVKARKDCATSEASSKEDVLAARGPIRVQKVIPGHGPAFPERRLAPKIAIEGDSRIDHDLIKNYQTEKDFIVEFPDRNGWTYNISFRKNGDFIVYWWDVSGHGKVENSAYAYCYDKQP